MPVCLYCKNSLTEEDLEKPFCPYCFPWTGQVQSNEIEVSTTATKEIVEKTLAVFKGSAPFDKIVHDQYPGYSVKGEIGKGGMGSVFLAREITAKRDVALKTFSPFTSRKSAEKIQERFLEEALITAQLQHPGIIPIYDIARDDSGRFFYTMRPVEGETLKSIINRLKKGDQKTAQKYPLKKLMQIMASVCQTMRFAHERGVIHRDLKPDNIIVGNYGEVLVIDWGLAKVIRKAAIMPHEDTSGGYAEV